MAVLVVLLVVVVIFAIKSVVNLLLVEASVFVLVEVEVFVNTVVVDTVVLNSVDVVLSIYILNFNLFFLGQEEIISIHFVLYQSD